jgi:hypothetical protein
LEPNLDKPFGQPQHLIHRLDKDSKDIFFLFTTPPDNNLNLLLPDGGGGSRGIKVVDFSGPFKTGREVCAVGGSKLGSRMLNAWNSWTYFSCQGSSL